MSAEAQEPYMELGKEALQREYGKLLTEVKRKDLALNQLDSEAKAYSTCVKAIEALSRGRSSMSSPEQARIIDALANRFGVQMVTARKFHEMMQSRFGDPPSESEREELEPLAQRFKLLEDVLNPMRFGG